MAIDLRTHRLIFCRSISSRFTLASGSAREGQQSQEFTANVGVKPPIYDGIGNGRCHGADVDHS